MDREQPKELKWRRKEIENYLCDPATLYAYAELSGASDAAGPLFGRAEAVKRRAVMERVVQENVPPAAMNDPVHRFWITTKASDDFLDVVFARYFRELGLGMLLGKTDYHRLASLVPKERIDPEIAEKLDAIEEVAAKAMPLRDPDENE